MELRFFEDFEQDVLASIPQRYPGSTNLILGNYVGGWPMFLGQLAAPGPVVDASTKRLDVYAEFADSGPQLEQGYNTGHQYFGAFIVRGLVGGGLRFTTVARTVTGNISVDVPWPDLRGINSLYVVCDFEAGQITVYINHQLAVLRHEFPNWVPYTNLQAERRVSVTPGTGNASAEALPNALTKIVAVTDVPQGRTLDLSSIEFRQVPLTAVNPIGVEFSDVGYVQDVSKNNPLLELPSVFSEGDGSITYEVPPASANVIGRKLYAAGRTDNSKSLYLNGDALALTRTQAALPVMEASIAPVLVEIKDPPSLKLTINTTAANGVFSPRFTSGNAIEINWGDGSPVQVVGSGARADHTYAAPGTYEVVIVGACASMTLACPHLVSVEDWGRTGASSILFYKASGTGDPELTSPRLVAMPANFPDTITNMANMFNGSGSIGDLSLWDVSRVTSMAATFRNSSFNGDISLWDTGNVLTMRYMFERNAAFNKAIGDWDVSKVRDMYWMFAFASAFNQAIGSWDTSSVTTMESMFYAASFFNQAIGTWNVALVTAMTGMFLSASRFNQNLSMWCVTNIKSQPSNFATNANAWTLPKPVWGTCPAP